MEKAWEQKVDDLIGLYQTRLAQIRGQLHEALARKFIKKAAHRERARIVGALEHSLLQYQQARALSGHGGKLRIDIGLPPLASLNKNEIPLVEKYLSSRLQSILDLTPVVKKLAKWVQDKAEGRVRGSLGSMLRLSAMKDVSSRLDKKLKQSTTDAEAFNASLLGLCKELGQQPIHKDLGGAHLAKLLEDLKSASDRIVRAEGRLTEVLRDLSIRERQVSEGLRTLQNPIPDLGMPELLSFVVEADPLLDEDGYELDGGLPSQEEMDPSFRGRREMEGGL